MKCIKDVVKLYAITDRTKFDDATFYEKVEQSLIGGVTCIQLREKQCDEKTFLDIAFKIKEMCKKYDVPLVINDNVDIAIKCGADGVHIGQDDIEINDALKKINANIFLGVSVQTVEQAKYAQNKGANYLGVGAIFDTTTKNDAKTVPIETLTNICKAVSIPVVAIGGIDTNNMHLLNNSGIKGVALSSAIYSKSDIIKQCKELLLLTDKL